MTVVQETTRTVTQPVLCVDDGERVDFVSFSTHRPLSVIEFVGNFSVFFTTTSADGRH